MVGAKMDLNMWLLFLKEFNGVSIECGLPMTSCSSSLMQVEDRFRGAFVEQWFQGRWPEFVLHQWWLWFCGANRLRVKGSLTYNEAVVSIINGQTSKCIEITKFLRFFFLQCLKNNVAFSARHIPGCENNVAEALSRFQVKLFRSLVPLAEPDGFLVPEFL